MKKMYLIGLGILIFAVLITIFVVISQPDNTKSMSKVVSNSNVKVRKTYQLTEVAKHNKANDCWTIINKKVYDITDEINQHPGGQEIIRACGIDATKLFNQRMTDSGESIGSGTPHSSNAKSLLESMFIGNLQE